MTTENQILRVENLSHKYNTNWAIRDISFDISKKGILGLLGSNGAGKSTTMNIICGVLNQSAGEVFINGISLRDEPKMAKRQLGFLPQKAPLYHDLTVDEYLLYCANLRDIEKSKIKSALETAKEKCGIGHFSKRLIGNLSGGYQQRVGIAQAIIHDPAFVVLDEPTNGLDPNQIIEVRHLIKDIGRERAVLVSTHILSEVQATCDEIRMIEGGQMVFAGTMRDFDSYIDPDSIFMTLDNPPPLSRMYEIENITEIEELGRNAFRLRFSGSEQIVQQLVAMSVTEEWGLTEIRVEKRSMDEVFAKLSKKTFRKY